MGDEFDAVAALMGLSTQPCIAKKIASVLTVRKEKKIRKATETKKKKASRMGKSQREAKTQKRTKGSGDEFTFNVAPRITTKVVDSPKLRADQLFISKADASPLPPPPRKIHRQPSGNHDAGGEQATIAQIFQQIISQREYQAPPLPLPSAQVRSSLLEELFHRINAPAPQPTQDLADTTNTTAIIAALQSQLQPSQAHSRPAVAYNDILENPLRNRENPTNWDTTMGGGGNTVALLLANIQEQLRRSQAPPQTPPPRSNNWDVMFANIFQSQQSQATDTASVSPYPSEGTSQQTAEVASMLSALLQRNTTNNGYLQ